MSEWTEAQSWERCWWGTCQNTFDEELKQLVVFKRFGFTETTNAKTHFVFDMQGKSVLDIGGGPCSFLLKCTNVRGSVVDPCSYPHWVFERYNAAKIWYLQAKAEDVDDLNVDEVWMYNLLQHVENPQKIVENAKKIGKLIRVFDWLEQGVLPGHPHNLTEEQMNQWFGNQGTVEEIDENGAKGKCYYGIFEK